MKNSIKKIVTLLLIIATLFCLAACDKNNNADSTPTPTQTFGGENVIKKEGVWTNATYTTNITFGEGAKTLTVKVEADGQAVIFTIKTDKETVGDALLEHSLINGEQSEYGLFIKSVNGIRADYDLDKAYWGFYQNGEYMMTGVDTTKFESGQSYELVYTKA